MAEDAGETGMTRRNQLHHGDCLEVMPTLEAGCVDMVMCITLAMSASTWYDIDQSMEVLWTNDTS